MNIYSSAHQIHTEISFVEQDIRSAKATNRDLEAHALLLEELKRRRQYLKSLDLEKLHLLNRIDQASTY